MATVEGVESFSAIASADLSTNQFHFVTLGVGSGLALAGAGGAGAVGILNNKPGEVTAAAGEVGGVWYKGTGKVVVGTFGTIIEGDSLTSDVNGKAVEATSGDTVIGRAREAATANDQVISILLVSPHIIP